MNAETIKDFLVSLGFQVDESGSRKFESVVAGATANVVKMGVAVEAAALSVVAFTAKISSGLDSLYWASQRTGTTVHGIKQIGYAVSQVGGSAEAARGSLESLSRFMRNNPGAEGFLNRLGVQTRDASGNMRDMSAVFTGVGQQLSKMPYYRANQYAQMLGIDENTLMAMRRGVGEFSAQYSQMAKAIGYNADTAAVSSNKFMTSLRSFGEMAGMARDKIGSNLAEGLSGSIDNLRKLVLDNFPKIEGAITSGVKGLLWLADVIGRVVFRLIQAAGDVQAWWGTLDKGTKRLIETFGALVIAWRVLNSAFLTSPIGIVASLGLAIFGLYDDYKAWKEGGKSLIDWKRWEPGIDSALKSIATMTKSVKNLAREVAALFDIDPKAWSIKWEFSNLTHNLGELGKMLKLIGDLLSALDEGRWSDAAGIGKELLSQGKDNKDALPGVTENAKESRSWLAEKYAEANGLLNKYLPQSLGGSTNTASTEDVEQHAQAARKIKGTDLPGALASQLNGAVEKVKGQKFAETFTDSLLKIVQRTAAYMPDAQTTAGAYPDAPQPTASGSALLGWLQPTLDKMEKLYQLPSGLLKSVAITESAGNPNAVSGAGAQGLFQIMPATGRDLGLQGNDAFDPVKSAQAAAKYLGQLMKTNNGDLSKTLASYNWGIGNVQKHGMALMPKETRDYIPRVMSNMPSAGATVSQETNIHIHGVSDPREAGNIVAEKQNMVNSRAIQQVNRGSS